MFSHTQKQEVTQHLIFVPISILKQKKLKILTIWVVDAGYVWFNWFFYHNDLNIRRCFLWGFFVMINLSAVALFVLGVSFDFSDSSS